MGVSINFDLSQHVIVLTYEDEWTWRESSATFAQSMTEAAAHHPMPAYIIDLSRNTYLPASGLSAHIQQLADFAHDHPPVAIWAIIMPDNPMRELLSVALQRVSQPQCQYHFVTTHDEAYQLIGNR